MRDEICDIVSCDIIYRPIQLSYTGISILLDRLRLNAIFFNPYLAYSTFLACSIAILPFSRVVSVSQLQSQ